jgi:importin subunit alpha-1
MNKYDQNVRFYCIKIVANLLSGNDVQTQTFIQEGVIDLYKGLIEDTDIGIIKEVLWGISNICGGTVSQIEKVYESGVFNRVMELGNYLLPRADEDQIYYQVIKTSIY